jgi:Bacterial Ig-like domain (group 2)./CotH protein./Listeria-Bacteroides repeat domain (List_Bact_rpt).
MMDIESAAKYWLVMQASRNADAYSTGSTYLYKPRGKKMYWGPLWDFDYAWYYVQDYDGFNIIHTWLPAMLTDKGPGGFVEEIKKQWPTVKAGLLALAEDGGIIDKYYEETKLSQKKDLELYPIEMPPMGGQTFDPETDKEMLKTWIKNRVGWIDENIDSIGNLIHKIVFNVEGTYYNYFLEDGMCPTLQIASPEIEGYFFVGWVDENGNTIDGDFHCSEDMLLTAVFISEEEATKPVDILFQNNEDYVKLRDGYYNLHYTIVPEDAQDQRIVWTVSDEAVAALDDNGILFFQKAGDIEVTATLSSGQTKSFTLHIVDGDTPKLQSIKTEKDVYEMKPGAYEQPILIREPYNASIDSYSYSSDNPEVVTINEYGAMIAKKPGSTVVHIKATYYDGISKMVDIETDCEVVVKESQPEPIKTIEYHFTEGNDQIWKKGSGEQAVFVCERSIDDTETFGHFTGIKIDGADADESVYTAEAGSVIIKLKPDYLETLDKGQHRVTAVFDDGTADADFTVVSGEKKEEETEEKSEESTSEESSSEENTSEEKITEESSTEENSTQEGSTEKGSTEQSGSTEKKTENNNQNNKSQDNNAKTVDYTAVELYLIMMIISGAAVFVIAYRKKIR